VIATGVHKRQNFDIRAQYLIEHPQVAYSLYTSYRSLRVVHPLSDFHTVAAYVQFKFSCPLPKVRSQQPTDIKWRQGHTITLPPLATSRFVAVGSQLRLLFSRISGSKSVPIESDEVVNECKLLI
jgi:hypothetical protein